MAKKIIVENAEEQIKNLASAFLTLSDVDECYAFFDDLFTTKEIAEISSRLEVARLLKAGENYIDIATKTGASTATISRVSKCLSGAHGGYRTVLKRLAESDEEREGSIIRMDQMSGEEAQALRAVAACFKKK